jgi:hypothetical protein
VDRLKRLLKQAQDRYHAWRRVRHERSDQRRQARKRREVRRAERTQVVAERERVRKRIDRRLPIAEETEEALYRLRVDYRDLGVRLNELNAAIDDFTSKLHRLGPKLERAIKRTRYYVHVRIPNIKRRIERAQQDSGLDPMGSSIVTFDGKPVVEWLAYRLVAARAAGWPGVLNSGYRSPEASEALCYQICGAPVCPGRCAGRTSNHTKNIYPGGAIDVSDPATFAALMRSLSGRIPGVVIFNALGAADPWHMSATGG